MAANNNDKASKTSNGGIPASTTVTATRASGVTGISVGSQSNWPTDTGIKFQTYKVDTNNKFVPGSLTDWVGVSNGTNTINSILPVGGAGDVGNAIGDVVVMSPTARWGEDFVEAFLQEHTNPLGKHGNITTTAITNNGNYSQSSGTFAVPDGSIDANELSSSAITLGYAQITTSYNLTSSTPTQVPSLTATVTVPGSRRIKVTFFSTTIISSSSGTPVISIWDGAVGGGTQIAQSNGSNLNSGTPGTCVAVVQPAAGVKTYNIGFSSTAGTGTIGCSDTGPAFILVEAI